MMQKKEIGVNLCSEVYEPLIMLKTKDKSKRNHPKKHRKKIFPK